jgi:hypothetical protein
MIHAYDPRVVCLCDHRGYLRHELLRKHAGVARRGYFVVLAVFFGLSGTASRGGPACYTELSLLMAEMGPEISALTLNGYTVLHI